MPLIIARHSLRGYIAAFSALLPVQLACGRPSVHLPSVPLHVLLRASLTPRMLDIHLVGFFTGSDSPPSSPTMPY